MAVLKHIASKNADYTAAEQYLVFQHDESSGKLLLDESGYPMLREKYILQGINCDAYNFAAECRKANRKYKKNKGETEIKTHHYIISFDPKDKVEPGLTIEKAQEMGMAFAAEHFPGHQMLVCAHADGHNGAGNIHVHIVLNSLRIQDIEPLPYKQRRCDCRAGFKHNCTKDFMSYLRTDLMKLCRENGLHQVDLTQSRKRVTNEEYRVEQRGQEALDQENAILIQKGQKPERTKFETEKEKIRQAILDTICVSHSPEEFQKILQDQHGIQVKESRGRWSYLPQGRTKPITGRKLGDIFEKAAILEAIQWERTVPETAVSLPGTQKENALTSVHGGQKLEPKIKDDSTIENRADRSGLSGALNLGQIIDLEKNEKAKNSDAYARWIKIHNLQVQAKTFSFMLEHGLLNNTELDEEYDLLTKQFRECRSQMKSTETELKEVNHRLRLLGQYFKGKRAYREYCRCGKQPVFLKEHQAELELYEAASRELREIYGDQKLPGVKELKEQKVILQSQKDAQYEAFKEIRKQWMDLGKVVRNRDSFLKKMPEQYKEKKRTGDLE